MKKYLTKNFSLAMGVGAGNAIYQYFFNSTDEFDFYKPVFIALVTFVLLSIYSAVKYQK
ncbi:MULTISPECIES: hypothetical protein [Pseudoalteromonas]|uniref:hypothetical protein n=1 Tax=Pseudoalteromonas TaxID=53246 RepID=UPI000927D24B|nr:MULTISPECIES: hypothetical protein [Pseudoalteromonas]WFO20968.1 hypothetical protein ATS73_016445 [Pseudoalteromonas sp. H100]SIO21618.1 hypothetical protein SAMN05878071_3292 [Pseudoalteromonas marina]